MNKDAVEDAKRNAQLNSKIFIGINRETDDII